MKMIRYLRPALIMAVLFLFSCAKPQIPPAPPTIPDTPGAPTDTPQIDSVRLPEMRPVPPKPNRPAVVDVMISKAKKQLVQNRPDEAFRILERALAVDGHDPVIWHLMAKAQLAQGDFYQAKSLAGKSNTLAGEDTGLREQNRTIINQAEHQLSKK